MYVKYGSKYVGLCNYIYLFIYLENEQNMGSGGMERGASHL